MFNLQKAGGIAALVEAMAYVVGFAVMATLLNPGDTEGWTPAQKLSFVLERQSILQVFTILIYVVFGIALVFLAVALHERLNVRSLDLMKIEPRSVLSGPAWESQRDGWECWASSCGRTSLSRCGAGGLCVVGDRRRSGRARRWSGDSRGRVGAVDQRCFITIERTSKRPKLPGVYRRRGWHLLRLFRRLESWAQSLASAKSVVCMARHHLLRARPQLPG